jgi:hypothetical protein
MITLTKPIQAHGKETSELSFREPNGGDIAACGFPFKFTVNEDGTQTIMPEAAAITQLISRLGNIPLSSARTLSFTDWMSCMGEVFSFFGQSIPQPLSNGASTSLGSGNGSLVTPSA